MNLHSIGYNVSMGAELQTNQDRVVHIKEARERFETFINGQKKGWSGSKGAEKRSEKVEDEYAAYGSISIYEGCHEQYVEGVTILVKTLNSLTKMGVHTKLQLLVLNTMEAAKNTHGFGERNVIVTELLKDIYRAELE